MDKYGKGKKSERVWQRERERERRGSKSETVKKRQL